MNLILFFKSHISGHIRGNTYVHDHYRKAAKVAAAKHKDQTRKDGKTPYIAHPVQVASILSRKRKKPISILLSALLHDTLEDLQPMMNLFTSSAKKSWCWKLPMTSVFQAGEQGCASRKAMVT